jgi:hypothetical protein
MALRTFAVAFFCMGTNELHVEVIEAVDWITAAKAHTKTKFLAINEDAAMRELDQKDIDNCLNTVEEAKEFAFNSDAAFDIVELSTGPASDQTIFFHDPDGTRSRRIATTEGEDADPLAGFDLDP